MKSQGWNCILTTKFSNLGESDNMHYKKVLIISRSAISSSGTMTYQGPVPAKHLGMIFSLSTEVDHWTIYLPTYKCLN